VDSERAGVLATIAEARASRSPSSAYSDAGLRVEDVHLTWVNAEADRAPFGRTLARI
jgi:hypothetical protein